MTDTAKVPCTFRMQPKNLDGLKKLAEETKRTVSALIDDAITEYLSRTGNEPSLSTGLPISSAELIKAAAVIEAIGTPIPMNLFLQILDLQKNLAVSTAEVHPNA